MCCTERLRHCANVTGATAGDGVGNWAGPPVVQAPVLSAAVAGEACATASDGGGSRAGPPVVGPPVAQVSVLAGVVPVPAHVAKAPALAAEVGAPAPGRRWLKKRAKKSAATARVVSASTPAEVVPAVATAAPAPKWTTKRAKNVAVGTAAVAVTAEVVSAPAPTAKAPAAPPPVAVLAAPAPAQKLSMRHIFNSVLKVVESSGTFVDPNIVGSNVEVVGTGESQRGRSCGEHNVCGTALVRVGSYVCFAKARFAWRDGKEEDVVEVFHVEEGHKMCNVGYLAKHFTFRADQYDGLCARIMEVYSDDQTVCDNAAKRLKFHRNIGCCVAVFIGMKDMFAL